MAEARGVVMPEGRGLRIGWLLAAVAARCPGVGRDRNEFGGGGLLALTIIMLFLFPPLGYARLALSLTFDVLSYKLVRSIAEAV